MANYDQVHSQWGQPLDQYVNSWGLESVQKRANWDDHTESKIRHRARIAISKICDLAENKNASWSQVTISMLQSILDLTLSPGTFAELGYPGLVGGCMKLLALVKNSGEISPFSYEYGYLCFRILVIALDVCSLQRAKVFGATVARMRAEPQSELLLVLSEDVSKLLRDLVSDAEGMGRLDWMLGLRASGDPDRLPQRPFATPQEPLRLLIILCQDAKYFSQAFDSTYSPGLSLVFCMFWRYVQARDDGLIEYRDPFLRSALSQMFFRYCIVAPPCDDPILASMYNRDPSWWAAARQAHIDDQDERSKISAYIGRFSSADTCWLSQPPISLVPPLLQFLLSRVADGIEDLLPRFLGLTIDRLWKARLGQEVSPDQLLLIAADTMTFLGHALECLIEKSFSDEQVIIEIIDVLIDHDMLDFIVQTAFLMPVRPEGTSEDPNKIFMNRAGWMWDFVGKILPKTVLRSKFQAIIPDMMKYVAYAIQSRDMEDDLTTRTARFRLMSQNVVCIGYVLGFEEEMNAVHSRIGFCVNERCHDPAQREISMFACDGCGEAYCGRYCQARDWMQGSLRKWHRISCGDILPRKVDLPWGLVHQVTRALTEGPNRFPIEEFMH